jgi:hypothetical protein
VLAPAGQQAPKPESKLADRPALKLAVESKRGKSKPKQPLNAKQRRLHTRQKQQIRVAYRRPGWPQGAICVQQAARTHPDREWRRL